MTDKKLSIILPVHNEKESLAIMVRLLISSLKFEHEIIIIHDSEEDNALEEANKLKKEFSNIKVIHNSLGRGVRNAVETGIQNSEYELILITAVDEIFPIISIDHMLDKLLNGEFDFISGTRYSKGGSRLGGSLIGSILSRIANKAFNYLSKIELTDCTTGIKMFKKNVWKNIDFQSKQVGWAFAFEFSIKAYIGGYKTSEYPIKSVDRLFGGSSTFKFGPWVKEYLKLFIWGINKIRKYEKKK
jgi:dolichol-phosphate mannosyltransferase